jgi:complex III assembly factor LYRM7
MRSLTISGDVHTLYSARAEARKNFESNRNLRIGSEELEKSLVHAEEVSKFLRENVVQGQAQDTEGNYSMLKHDVATGIWLIGYRATDTRAHRTRR